MGLYVLVLHGVIFYSTTDNSLVIVPFLLIALPSCTGAPLSETK